MQPTVLINRHRQTAIIVNRQGNKLQLIRMGKGQLTVSSLSIGEIESLGYQVCNYSPSEAASTYLQHGAGVSKRARKYLQELTHNPLPGVLGGVDLP